MDISPHRVRTAEFRTVKRGLDPDEVREFLSEVPAERVKTPLKAADVPRLFTTETFCKVVIRAQRAAQPAT